MMRGGCPVCRVCGGSREDRLADACRECRAALRTERLRAARRWLVVALGRGLVLGAATAALTRLWYCGSA